MTAARRRRDGKLGTSRTSMLTSGRVLVKAGTANARLAPRRVMREVVHASIACVMLLRI